ncbi:thioredoxin-like protein [Gautieria morchelliformis]|nr:thioredoxin-like protein [Gautieria morchelliformis]
MSQQLPFAVKNGGPNRFYRRKRILFGLAAGVVTLFLILRTSLFTRSSTAVTIDELNGLLYTVAHTKHVLPHTLDPSGPIAPSVWVPGEPINSKLWPQRIAKLDQTPLIVFSKSYCPYSRRAKDLLARYGLNPVPHIVEVDLRDDGDIIKRLLTRLTDHATFPNIILRGRSLGGYDDLQHLHETGVLEHELEEAGVHVTGNVFAQ